MTGPAPSLPRRRVQTVRRGTPVPIVPALVAMALTASALAPSPAAAQTDSIRRQIQESQLRLEEIRAERERLQREMQSVRSRVRNTAAELQNIERQISASRSVLAELEFQLEATGQRVEGTSSRLLRTRERLRAGDATLNRRLRDAYKLGPLHTIRVLLAAESFPDLLNRYRYLSLIAEYDRALVSEVQELERSLEVQSRELQRTLSELDVLRQQRLGEVAELRAVEQDHQRALESFRSRERQTMGRLDQLEEDERRMTSLIGELERARIEAERRRTVSGRGDVAPTLGSGDAGSLAWPVDGEVVYRFGRERRPNGTVLRWNGLGIAAPLGTPVQAVRGGTVVLAGPFEGYGPTVIVSHGDGFYTLYLYLDEIGVVEGRVVAAGDVLGTVGGAGTPEGPHIEFQIRAPVGGSAPQAMDPLRWLRSRPGAG